MLRRWAVAYLVLQGVAVAAWWTALLTTAAVREVFELGDPAVLDAFLPADVLLAAASTGAGLLAARHHRNAGALAAAALGAVLYSTAMTASFAASSGEGGIGVVAMVAASAGTAGSFLVLRRGAADAPARGAG